MPIRKPFKRFSTIAGPRSPRLKPGANQITSEVANGISEETLITVMMKLKSTKSRVYLLPLTASRRPLRNC
jgi:hypothetical protein